MEIIKLTNETAKYNKQAVKLLVQAFPHSYSDCADEEMINLLDEERILIGAVEEDKLLGFVGAIPQYGVTGWELHPLIVDNSIQRKGIGTALCEKLENILRDKGCLTIYLGSDDEFGKTTLSNVDLFDNTYEKIMSIKNINNHPYEFYQKVGYKIVGVIPNANGIGKPDIWLAKNIIKKL